MSFVKTGFAIDYIPDEEKSVEENKEKILKAITSMISDFQTNNYSVTIKIGSEDKLDSDEVEELLDSVESMSNLVEGMDLNTPVGIDEDGDPIFGVKKGDK